MNKHTERVISDIIDEFEAEVRRLLDEGHTPKYAVKEAYKKISCNGGDERYVNR